MHHLNWTLALAPVKVLCVARRETRPTRPLFIGAVSRRPAFDCLPTSSPDPAGQARRGPLKTPSVSQEPNSAAGDNGHRPATTRAQREPPESGQSLHHSAALLHPPASVGVAYAASGGRLSPPDGRAIFGRSIIAGNDFGAVAAAEWPAESGRADCCRRPRTGPP
jgi:hypothetical protein